MSDEEVEQLPSVEVRWLAAAPLFLGLAVVAVSLRDYLRFKDVFRQLRIELPLPTRVALNVGQQLIDYYFLAMPVMFMLAWFHFAWAAKSERRLAIASQIWLLFFVLGILCFVVGMYLPFFKIKAALGGASL